MPGRAIVGWVRNFVQPPANPAMPEPYPPGARQPPRKQGSRPARWLVRLLGTGLASCLAAGCTMGDAPSGQAASSAPASASAAARDGVSKILVIMEENHDAGEVFPNGMPYLWQLARTYGHATAWSAITHPSLPNYLAIFTGSSFNDPQDCQPGPGCTYPGPSVFGQALTAGQTARSYEESMPRPCDQSGSGNYDVNHNPWAYIPDETARCRANDVPSGTTADGALVSDVRQGTLPTVGLITPNLIHDAHNGTLAQADDWLRNWIPVLMSGPDWRSGHLAIAVVFDEGDTTNHVPFVLIAPGVSGAIVSTPVDHYALTRLIDKIIGAQPLRHAATAGNLAALFGLTVH
jgi:phosphatidylinositol-3-phosphatase